MICITRLHLLPCNESSITLRFYNALMHLGEKFIDRNNSILVKDMENYDFREGVGQKSQVQVQSNQNSLEDKDHLTATDIYSRLAQVIFDGDDSGNPGVWADIDHINPFINSAIMGNEGQVAYYVGPISFGFDTDEAVKDALKHICKRKTSDGSIINDHYSDGLDKPFIFIANIETTLIDPTLVNKKIGGLHWISWVLLPKKHTNLFGEEIEHDKYQVLFFDSLAQKKIPEKLKEGLTNGMNFVEGQVPITLLPFCKKSEIVFHDNSQLTGQQKNSDDCGWWASYYALMTVYTGNMQFLEQLKGRKLSAKPLRSIMNLEESTQWSSIQIQRKQKSTGDSFKVDGSEYGSVKKSRLSIQQDYDSSDYDSSMEPEEILIDVIRGDDAEKKKLIEMREAFQAVPKLNINFYKNGRTALHVATRKNEFMVVYFLLRVGANIDAHTNSHY